MLITIKSYLRYAITLTALVVVALSLEDIHWGLAYVSFFILGLQYTELVAHRYVTHSEFELPPVAHHILLGIAAIWGFTAPAMWRHHHTNHHRYEGTEKDPHPAELYGWRVIYKFNPANIKNLNLRSVKPVLGGKWDFWNHRAYLVNVFAPIVMLLTLPLEWVLYLWALPTLGHLSFLRTFGTWLAHIEWLGYKNYPERTGTNSPILWPFCFGLAWHNNHHRHPVNSPKCHWWEFDPLSFVIQHLTHR